MSTRLALVFAVLLLALALVQWGLRSIAERSSGGPAAIPVQPAAAVVEAESDSRSRQAVEEPVIEIPEYVPPRITERPKMPVEFSAHPVEIDLGIPRVEGTIEDDPGAPDGD